MAEENDYPAVRSRAEIKQNLLRKAWDGNSRYSAPEMIALIQERVRRGKDLSAEHEIELALIDHEEPRAIRALNLLEKENGSDRRYTDQSRRQPKPTIN
jgi:hypothetical protein